MSSWLMSSWEGSAKEPCKVAGSLTSLQQGS
jgi:hypothetical protein